MAFTKGATEDEFFFDILELNIRGFDKYDGLSISPEVGPYVTNYVYAATHHLISRSLSIAAILPAAYTIASLSRYCINTLSGRNRLVYFKKLKRLFLFNPDNVMRKTLEATTQLGGLNQFLMMRQSNNILPYSGPHQYKDETINTLFYSVQDPDGTTAVEFIVRTKTLIMDVYAIGFKSGLNISKVLQDRFHKLGININICSRNAQE